MADKIHETRIGNKNQNKTIEQIFKEAHDYLEKLELSMGKLLKKFHLNAGSFDGEIDNKTTQNHIEEVYQEKILKLKSDLLSHKKTMNKHLLVNQLIAMTISARGLEMSELSKTAKEKLDKNEFTKFEKEKIELIRNNDFSDFQKDINQAAQKIDENIWRKEEKEAYKESIKKVKNATEALNKKEIDLSTWEKIINEAKHNSGNIESFSKDVGKYLEWAMISGTVPVAMITLKKGMGTLKVLPSIIGLNIYNKLFITAANNSERLETVKSTVASITPILGSIIATNDTKKAWDNYKNGKGELGDVVANGVGATISWTFDGLTVIAVASGVGIPAAAGLSTVRRAFTRGAVEGIKILSKDFIYGNSKILLKTIAKHPVKVGQQIIKDTGEGMWNIVSLKGLRETALGEKSINKVFRYAEEKTLDARVKIAKGLEKTKLVPDGMSKRMMNNSYAESRLILSELDSEKARQVESENDVKKLEVQKSAESLNTLIANIEKQTKNGDEKLLSHMLDSLKTKDFYIGESLNSLYDIDKILKKGMDNEKTVKEIMKVYENNKNRMSKNLQSFITDFIVKNLGDGKSFAEGSPYKLILENKIHGERVFENIEFFGGDKYKTEETLKEIKEILKENGIGKTAQGYAESSFKIEANLKHTIDEILKKDPNNPRLETLITGYLDIIKQGDKLGWGKNKLFYLKGGREDIGQDIDSGKIYSSYEEKINTFLSNKSDKLILKLVDHIDVSLIKDKKLLEKIGTSIGAEIIKSFRNDTDLNILFKKLKRFEGNETVMHGLNSTLSKAKAEIKSRIIDEIKDNNRGLLNVLNIEALKEIKNKEGENITEKHILKNSDLTIEKILERNNDVEVDVFLKSVLKMSTEGKKAIYAKIEKKSGMSIEDFIAKHTVSPEVACDIINIKIDNANKNLFVEENYIKDDEYSLEYTFKVLERTYPNDMITKKVNIPENIKKLLEAKLLGDESVYTEKLKYEDSKYKLNAGNLDLINHYKKIFNLEIDTTKLGINTYEYKNRRAETNIVANNLLNFDRVYSIDDLRLYKQTGKLTHATLEKLNIAYSRKGISEIEKTKLEYIINDVKKVLNEYNYHIFDIGEYKTKSLEEKVNYIEKALSISSNASAQEVNKHIIEQLSTFKEKYNIEGEVIKNYLYKFLSETRYSNLGVKEKIKLLKDIEENGVYKPSSEIKLEFMIKLDGNSDNIRDNAIYMKDYVDRFERKFNEEFEKIAKKDTETRIKLVERTKSMREPVNKKYMIDNGFFDISGNPIKDGNGNLREDEYVILTNKEGNPEYYIVNIKPNRYFINQMLKSTDLKMKETYMELIKDKTDFGEKSIKDYFNEALEKNDIETAILMTYHKDMVGSPESLKLLEKYYKDPKYMSLVLYSKIKGGHEDILRGLGKNDLNREKLEQIITKEYVEATTGQKLDDAKYESAKKVIIDVILLNNNDDIKSLVLSVRSNDENIDKKGLALTLHKLGVEDNTIKELLSLNNKEIHSIVNIIEKTENNLNINQIYKDIIKYVKEYGLTSKITDLLDDIAAGKEIKVEDSYQRLFGVEIKEGMTMSSVRDMRATMSEKGNENKETSLLKELRNTPLNTEKLGLSKQVAEMLGKNKLTVTMLTGLLVKENLMGRDEQKRQEGRILEDWKTSSEYQKYISLGGENSPEAKQLMADTITKLTKERLQIYLSMLDPAKKDMFEGQINKFSPRARVFLRDLNKRVIAEIGENEAKNITKDMYIFVQSVDKSTGKSIELLNKILDKYPKLKNNKTIIEIFNTRGDADQRKGRKTLSEMRKGL